MCIDITCVLPVSPSFYFSYIIPGERSWQEQVNFRRNDDEVRFVLDQQSADRHVTLLGHIILIMSQLVFALSPKCCVLG